MPLVRACPALTAPSTTATQASLPAFFGRDAGVVFGALRPGEPWNQAGVSRQKTFGRVWAGLVHLVACPRGVLYPLEPACGLTLRVALLFPSSVAYLPRHQHFRLAFPERPAERRTAPTPSPVLSLPLPTQIRPARSAIEVGDRLASLLPRGLQIGVAEAWREEGLRFRLFHPPTRLGLGRGAPPRRRAAAPHARGHLRGARRRARSASCLDRGGPRGGDASGP
jgi:hypothetical protein